MSTSVEQTVMTIISDQMGMPVDTLNVDQSWTDVGFDSLETVETVMAIEDKYGIEIPDETAENIKTIKDLVDYIKENADVNEEA